MILTNERAETLAKILNEMPEILERSVEEALGIVNGKGNDFTAEELHDFADLIELIQKKDELDESSLDDVSGGALFTTTISTISWIAKQYTNRKFRIRW